MIKTSKKFNILFTVVLLTVLFACAIHTTLAYFTAITNANGDIAFYDLQVACLVKDGSDNDITSTSGATSIEFVETAVALGGCSQLKQDSYTGVHVDLELVGNSCDCYVRMWIDAYIVNNDVVDTTTNYGADFTLKRFNAGVYSNPAWLSRSTYVDNNHTYAVYYLINTSDNTAPSLDSDTTSRTIFNAIQLNSNADPSLVGSKVLIRFSYEAIQAGNGAVATWASDEKGKYTNWS